MAGNPSRLFVRLLTTYTVWEHNFCLSDNVTDAVSLTWRGLWSGPQSERVGYCNFGVLLRLFHISSDTVVTSAPVSTLKVTGWVCISTSVVQVAFEPSLTVLR